MQALQCITLPKSAAPYRYELDGIHRYAVGRQFPNAVGTSRFVALREGSIILADGYRWDGPSGPTIDTPSWMIASLVHDGLYQLMREGSIPESCRRDADVLMMELLKLHGMPWWRRAYTWAGVRLFGGRFATRR